MNDIPQKEKADSGRVRSGCEGVNPVVGRRIVGIDISSGEDHTACCSIGDHVLKPIGPCFGPTYSAE